MFTFCDHRRFPKGFHCCWCQLEDWYFTCQLVGRMDRLLALVALRRARVACVGGQVFSGLLPGGLAGSVPGWCWWLAGWHRPIPKINFSGVRAWNYINRQINPNLQRFRFEGGQPDWVVCPNCPNQLASESLELAWNRWLPEFVVGIIFSQIGPRAGFGVCPNYGLNLAPELACPNHPELNSSCGIHKLLHL